MQSDSPQPRRSIYLDFELEIGLGRGREYPVMVLDSPAGGAHVTMHFPFDDLALDNRLSKLQIALLRSGGKHRRVPSEEEQAVQDLGRSLFDALFSGRARTCYDVSLREAAKQDKGLRLKLRIRPPELSALPWEFLYDPDQAEYVCLSRQTPIVRYLESPRLIRPLTVSPPLRILGMVASPQDLPVLDVEREKQRVERATQNLRDRGLLELKWLPGQTWRDLQEAMWGGPWHVFHFVGHGGFDVQADEGFIALADRAGHMSGLSATRLARLLADHAALRLVLLNACEGARGSERDVYSSTASILVHRGIPAVVAMQYEITDQAAIEFARAFYRALAYGMAVDEAVVAARKAIDLAVTNTVEWGTPILYMRSPDGVLFQITKRPGVEQPVLREAKLPPKDEEEQEKRLNKLYAAGVSARWREDWDEACRCFEAIVAERPDHQDAAAKLEHAKLQRTLADLYARAQAAREEEDWSGALAALEELVSEQADYKDAADLLKRVKTRKELADLYAEARHLHRAREWELVVKVFADIAALASDYPDPEDLLATAEQEVADQQRQTKLGSLHDRAVLAMEDGRWREARGLLHQVEEIEPGFRDNDKLLARVEVEIERKETERQCQALYEQAQALAKGEAWLQALAKMEELQELDPQFADPEGLAARAKKEVERLRRWEGLYGQAQAAREAEQWSAAVAALEALVDEASDFRDATDLLEEARERKKLADLYAQAHAQYRAKQWQAVVDVFPEIHDIDPDYADPESLLPSAKQRLAEEERQAELDDLYIRASQAVDAGQWAGARRLLLQVKEQQPGYRETERLLAQTGSEIEREQKRQAERQRREQAAGLYDEAQALARAGQWRQASAKMGQIRALDPQFPDSEGIAARAQTEVARLEQEARRPGKLTALAELIPKMRRMSRWGMVAVGVGGGIAVIVVIILAVSSLSSLVFPASRTRTGKILIGINAPLTGDIPIVGEGTKYAAEMWLEDIEATGGLDVGGEKFQVELVVEDNEFKAESAAAANTKLITQDEVLVIVGPQASKQAVPAGGVANDGQTPMISPWSTNPNTTLDRPWVFRTGFLDPWQGPLVAVFVTEEFGFTKAAVLYDVASDYPRGLAEFFKFGWEDLHGEGSVVAFESFTTGDTDFSAQLARIKDSGAEFFFAPQYYNEVSLIVQQAHQMGWDAPIVGSDSWGSAWLMDLCGDDCKGLFFTTHYVAAGATGATKEFIDRYSERYGYVPDDVGALTWDTMLIVQEAIQDCGEISGDVDRDRQCIRDALARIENFEGITGKMSFTEEGDPVKCAVVARISDSGEFEFYKSVCP